MYTKKEHLGEALDIFKKLLNQEEVSANSNKELYDAYITSTEIEEYIQFICEKMDMEIYSYNKQLFLTPSINNQVFGYNNEELRNRIPYVNNNTQLYMIYFVGVVIITMFYKESAMDTSIPFIKIEQITEEVTNKLDALIDEEELEDISNEYQFNFADIAKEWKNLLTTVENNSGRGISDKFKLTNAACRFLADEKLITIDMNREIILPTDRFKGIVYKYFETKANKSKVLDYIYSL